MPTLKQHFILILVLVFSLISSSLNGDALYEIQTGKNDSASWQFTKQLSEYWQRNQILKEELQNTGSYFVPKYVDGFLKRFKNLNNRKCKLIIAPLRSVSELPINEMQIKIAVVLWEVYLAPINMKGGSNEIKMFDDQTWLIPEDSLIIPSFLTSMQASLPDSSADMKPELIEFIKSINWSPTKSRRVRADATGEYKSESNPKAVFNTSIGATSTFGGYSDKLKMIERKSISTLFSDGIDGPLMFEMLGPYNKLLENIGDQYQISSLEDSLIRRLLKYNWFLEPFSISRLNVKTVGVTFALFVHENEDPEFVKELITLLIKHPQTNFSKPYLLKNLALGVTKEISPLFLHQSSIEFFNID